MAQGKMKVKSKVPDGAKGKNKKVKGSAITKRSNAPSLPKKKANDEAGKIKKMVSKNLNKRMEEDIRSLVTERKTKLSKAQQAVIADSSISRPAT